MKEHVVDFETANIESRPNYPPRPCGVAIRSPEGKKRYYAFNHKTGNNSSVQEARAAVAEAYSNPDGVVFHNGPFDMDVSEVHLGVQPPKKFHETIYLAFLNDPYEPDLKLKPLTDRHFDMPPEERDALKEWILTNVRQPSGRKVAESKWAEYINHAPGNVAEPYALSDVDRTAKLFKKLHPIIEKRGMLPAYQRELDCTPITMEMERSGIRVHRKRLRKARDVFYKFDKDVVRRIAKKLRVDPKNMLTGDELSAKDKKGKFNLNSSQQLADALISAGKLDSVVKTKTGKVSTKIENLETMCNDKDLIRLLAVHSVNEKYLTTFIDPWLAQAAQSGGRILPHFSQTRGRGSDGGGGARSGRFSSSNPNMQQVSANVDESKNKEVLLTLQKWIKEEHHYDFIGLRDYIIPDDGMIMISVDYNQQELRLLAHFELGELAAEYHRNPKLDVHEYIKQLILKLTGVDYERKYIKIVVFGMIYGQGVASLADKMSVERKVAQAIKDAILEAVPGIERIQDVLRTFAEEERPLVTWGGREYFCEPAKFITPKTGGPKRWVSFEYKMLNYLIQPSAADCTKQGMINVRDQVPEVRIALQVHDELVVMAPHRKYGARVAKAMCDIECGVPMLADPAYSDYSWARVKKEGV